MDAVTPPMTESRPQTGRMLEALHRRMANPALLNLSYGLAVRGPFDKELFDAALMHLQDAYPALLGGADADKRSRLSLIDARHLPPVCRMRVMQEEMRLEQSLVFQPGEEPLLRGRIVAFAHDFHALLLTFHHAAADAWSLDKYARALTDMHRGEKRPLRRGPADAPVLGSDGETRGSQLRHLGDGFRGITSKEIDPFSAHPAMPSMRLRDSHAIAGVPEGALDQAIKRLRVSAHIVLLAATAASLSLRWEMRAPLLGIFVPGRWTPFEIRDGGAYYEAAMVRFVVDRNDTLTEVVERAAEAQRWALSNRWPCGAAQELVQDWTGGTSQSPAVFVLMDQFPLTALRLPNSEIMPLTVFPVEAHEPIAIPTLPCGRVTFFLRQSQDGASLNTFCEPDLRPHSHEIEGDVLNFLSSLASREAVTVAQAFDREAQRSPLRWHDVGGLRAPRDVPVDLLSPIPSLDHPRAGRPVDA